MRGLHSSRRAVARRQLLNAASFSTKSSFGHAVSEQGHKLPSLAVYCDTEPALIALATRVIDTCLAEWELRVVSLSTK